jgi:hypothetical protein
VQVEQAVQEAQEIRPVQLRLEKVAQVELEEVVEMEVREVLELQA